MRKISIIIPAYNEEKRIENTLKEYASYFEKIKEKEQMNYEILVVINNTTDNTEKIVKKISSKIKNVNYINLKPGGKGFAVLEGFKHVLRNQASLIGFVDADMATSPKEFHKLIKNIKNRDGIIASRYIKGATITPKPSVKRLIAKRMFNTLVRGLLFLPHRDTQCGAKIFTKESVVKTLPKVKMSKWAFDVDLLYTMKKSGFKIIEFPTKWEDKEYSKIHFWKAGPGMALGVIRLRILNSPFRRIIFLYDKFYDYYRKK